LHSAALSPDIYFRMENCRMKKLSWAGCFSAVFALATCGVAAAQGGAAAAKNGVAVIQSASGSAVKGVVRFTQEGQSLKVTADLEGLTPNAQHGFHVHEFGDCTAPDATSAGSHYDAAGTKHHGKPADDKRHTGDMGNVAADAGGKAHYEVTLEGVSLAGPTAPVLGHAVIVHAKPDDFSQPVGNAGGRIGCGVIGVAK
jgi:Cu-Zn family superoxide dismutase